MVAYPRDAGLARTTDGETLDPLIKRMDKAIDHFYEDGQATDDINAPSN